MKRVYNSITLLVSLDERCTEELKELGKTGLLSGANSVRLVHIHNARSQRHLPTHLMPYQEKAVEDYVESYLRSLSGEILDNTSNVTHHCFFHNDDKARVLDYLQASKCDLVVAPTRGEQDVEGIFSDSFCYWLVSHAPCDVLVLRPRP